MNILFGLIINRLLHKAHANIKMIKYNFHILETKPKRKDMHKHKLYLKNKRI